LRDVCKRDARRENPQLAPAQGSEIDLRHPAIFVSAFKVICPVQSCSEKYPASLFGQISSPS
jgi:hypothetical protein